MPVTLYLMPGSCALSCHIALEWAGADYEVHPLDHDEVHEDAFLKVNPKGKVPALRLDDGGILTEALAVLAWIGETWPDAGLYGTDALSRARIIEALSEMTGEMHPAFAPLHVPGRYTEDDGGEAGVKDAAQNRIRGHYDRWNEHMEGRDRVQGDRRSIADAYLFAMGRWATMIDSRIEDWPYLAAFDDRMREDDAVRAALAAEKLDQG